ncbi:hypothetical protein ACWGJX_42270 [Streptomyces sp. NPDC054775]
MNHKDADRRTHSTAVQGGWGAPDDVKLSVPKALGPVKDRPAGNPVTAPAGSVAQQTTAEPEQELTLTEVPGVELPDPNVVISTPIPIGGPVGGVEVPVDEGPTLPGR